jgi:hypothetical protein
VATQRPIVSVQDGQDLEPKKTSVIKNCVKLISLLMQSAQIKMVKGITITLAIGAWGKQSIKESITATATNSAE